MTQWILVAIKRKQRVLNRLCIGFTQIPHDQFFKKPSKNVANFVCFFFEKYIVSFLKDLTYLLTELFIRKTITLLHIFYNIISINIPSVTKKNTSATSKLLLPVGQFV